MMEYKRDNSKMTKGRFIYEGCPTICCGFSTLKGNIQGREVNIVIGIEMLGTNNGRSGMRTTNLSSENY